MAACSTSTFSNEVKAFISSADSKLAEFTTPLKAAIENLDDLTAWLLA